MLKIKKLVITSLATVSLVFSASICAAAAQIDSLSIVDNTIYARVTAENARLYAVEGGEGLLSDVFFQDIVPGSDVELPVGEASEYSLYLWDRESLAPISAPYILRDGTAFPEGSETPLPQYEFSGYSFNQDDSVMVVSSISETEIKGFMSGVETTYPLTDSVAVLGISDNIADVVPGSVVLIGTNKKGDCAALELLASLGWPIDEEGFRADFGVHTPSDSSTRYQNVVNVVFGKSGSKLTIGTASNKQVYYFASSDTKCYRVGLAAMGDELVVSVEEKLGGARGDASSPIKSTSDFNNYVLLRVDTEQSKTVDNVTYNGLITQCIVFSVPKEFNFNPDDDPDGKYSPIFGLEPIVIID